MSAAEAAPACVLICSGLDPSGGAGFIADVRVVAALGARPVGVVTSLTVQNTQAVQQLQPVEPELIGTQLAALLGDVEVRAVKLGLLGSVEAARQIARGLELTAAPVVWDPIGAPTRGTVPFDGAQFDDLLRWLGPHLTLLTPNAYELGALVQGRVTDRASAIAAAQVLAARVGAAVLVKAGHLAAEDAADVLVHAGQLEVIEGARVAGGEDVHGTGCALSSAIATHLALGADLVTACRQAKAFVAAQLAAPARPGRGAPAVV